MSIYTEHAKRFLASCGIRITGKYKGRYVPLWDKEPHSTWEIVLRREDRQKGERHAIFITFYQSHADQHKTPTAYDVLACLCKSDCGSYQDFCEDMGLPEYDEETGERNMVSYSMYTGACHEYAELKTFFTRPGEWEELEEIY
jgi:hypothetical protein